MASKLACWKGLARPGFAAPNEFIVEDTRKIPSFCHCYVAAGGGAGVCFFWIGAAIQALQETR